jgi:hypothetical protein
MVMIGSPWRVTPSLLPLVDWIITINHCLHWWKLLPFSKFE